MIPITLDLDAFACYRTPTTIDFTEPEADLFAIAGATGSGKSAILDAMTFALYGQTARLGSRGVLETLVSPGHTRMSAQLTFATGGARYRVTRAVNVRDSGASQEVRVEREAADGWKQLPESEKIRDANAKLEEIVGLDYDGFTRAVLLPQGAFDEFLRGDPGKRRALLTSLLGLTRIDEMRAAARERATAARGREKELASRLVEEYGDATPEGLAELDDTVGLARERSDEVAGKLGALEAEAAAIAKAHEAAAKLRREEIRQAEAAKRLTPEALQKVERAEAARPVLDAAEAANTAFRNLDTATARLEEAEEAAAKLEEETAMLEEAAGEARRRAEVWAAERDAYEEAYPDLARGFQIIEDDPVADWATLTAKPADGRPFEWADLQALRERIRRVRDVRPLAAKVEAAEEAHKVAWGKLDAARAEAGKRAKEADEAQTRLRTAQAKLIEAEAEHEDAALQIHVNAVRRHHHENGGEGCDVCLLPLGDQTMPDPLEIPDLPDLGDLRAGEAEAAQAAAVATERRDAAARRVREAEEAEAEAAEALEAAREAHRAVNPHETPIPSETELEEHMTTLLHRLASWIRSKSFGMTPDDRRRDLIAKANAFTSEATKAAAAVNDHASKLAAAEERIREREAARKDAATAAEKADAAFEEAKEASPFDTFGEAVDARLPGEDLEAVRNEIAEARATVNAAEERIAEAKAELGAADPDGTRASRDPDAARRMAEEAKAEKEAAVAHLHRVTTMRDQLASRVERAKTLREDQKKLDARAALYSALHLDLHSDRFPAYLLNKAQDALAARASYVLRDVTDQRYDLALRDGEFHVIDAWGAGIARSVKTLSGGETFMASLALALALSEILIGHAELGALFLDEGFGTLDAQALDSVATVLESLTRDGRMVGVISHVDALTERMPARLMISKHATGSTARWEA